MEKDHFKYRTKETTLISAIHIGDFAYICEKKAQVYAKDLSDLTAVKITQILTKHDHPRGIKVKGIVYEAVEKGYKQTNREAVGRIVYLAEEN